MESENLFIRGWYFKIESGEVERYNSEMDVYIPLGKLHNSKTN